jgi:O-antigen/teichoic acid export membrane protein
MLLVGRLLAIAAGLVIQVLVVRYLTQAAFGAFSYCIAVVNLATVVVSLGMEQTMSRFAAIYDETGQRDRLAGALIVYLLVVAALGTVAVGAAVFGRDELSRLVIHDGRTARLLAIMMVLAPLQALDTLSSTLFAVYGRPAAIFWRRYVITPVLRIGVVVVVLVMQASVFVLGTGYVLATITGLLIYLPPLLHLLHRRGVITWARRPVLPIRELMVFTGTAVSADLLAIVLFASDAIIVGWVNGPTGVALLQATQPLANGNLVIFYALIPVFIPTASRLFASGARARGEELYATCSLWIAVFSFPVAALTIGCAATVTETFFGHRYAAAAPILALLSAGQYLLAVFGLSGLTLKAHGILRNLALACVTVTVLNIGANLLLVRRFGALGAALGTATAIALLTVAKCLIMRHDLGMWPVDGRLARALARILGLGGALVLFNVAARPNLLVDVLAAALCSALLVWTSRRDLGILDVFPEAARSVVLRSLLSVR